MRATAGIVAAGMRRIVYARFWVIWFQVAAHPRNIGMHHLGGNPERKILAVDRGFGMSVPKDAGAVSVPATSCIAGHAEHFRHLGDGK